MSKVPRPCPGWRDDPCGVPVVGGRCEKHRRARETGRRPNSHQRGYDRQYRRDRNDLLGVSRGERYPCELRLPGCTYWADTADHPEPLAKGGDRRQGLRRACKHCNSARGARDDPDSQIVDALPWLGLAGWSKDD